MNPETLQFQCGHCGMTLTVPVQMAGVSGPCPSCGQTVTSPSAPPVAAALFTPAPQWPPAPAAAAPASGFPSAPASGPGPNEAPSWSPPQSAVSPSAAAGPSQSYSDPEQQHAGFAGMPAPMAGGLPPRRAPGQPPLTSSLPGASLPGAAPSPAWASSPAADPAPAPAFPQGGLGGLPQGSFSSPGLPQNHSRLIPGAPALPTGPGALSGGGLHQGGIPGSLLGREVAPAPVSPPTQTLQASPLPPVTPLSPLSLGGAGAPPANHSNSAASARKMADLREPRGANVLRLAFAAVFLLGFLGLVGYFLKDYMPPAVMAYFHRESADETTAGQAEIPYVPTPTPALPTPPVVSRADKSNSEAEPPKSMAGFDPGESSAPSAPVVADTVSLTQKALDPSPNAPATTMPESASNNPVPTALPSSPETNAAAEAATPAPVAPKAANLGPGTIIAEDDGSIPEEAKPAVEALRSFLAATTVEERLRHTLGADLVRPLMERYYSKATEGAITVDKVQFIRLDPNPELGSGRHCILSVENKAWEYPVPVMLEEQKDGFKVDWIAFAEFKDRLLEKFFQTYQEGPMRFHVGIMRHHYFEDGVPNVDRKDAFRVGPAPPNLFQAYAFLDKDTPLATALRTRLPWEHHVWAIVDLEWKKLGSQQWVEVVGVPQMHWYSLPAAPSKSTSAPVKTLQKPSQEMPPGISKNGVGSANTSNLPPPGISKNGVGSGGDSSMPPGISKNGVGNAGTRGKSSKEVPPDIRRPLPVGR